MLPTLEVGLGISPIGGPVIDLTMTAFTRTRFLTKSTRFRVKIVKVEYHQMMCCDGAFKKIEKIEITFEFMTSSMVFHRILSDYFGSFWVEMWW